MAIVTQLAALERPQQGTHDPDDATPAPDAGGSPSPAQALESLHFLQTAPFNEQWFFKDSVRCPVSGTVFDHLRVRTGAVKPASRDSDFRSVYRTVDPGRYLVTVCPQCSYAAYQDDFEDLTDRERRTLLADQAERDRWERPNRCGERTLDQAAVALEIAHFCYQVRGADERRLAGLTHRRAWIERERGDAEAEMRLLREACDSYRLAYERDETVTDAEAVRAAYLIGALYLRTGETQLAARWLSRCVEMPEAKGGSGITRMARDRLSETRELLREQQSREQVP